MNLPQGEITSTPALCSESQVPHELTQEEEYPDEARSEIQYPTSVKSPYISGSFHSPSNEQPNVMQVSGAEIKTSSYSNRVFLDDSLSKFPLDSIASIGSDELFGSIHSPSEEQLNLISVLGAEGQTTGIDNQDKLLLPVAEDTVSILDESCQYANVPLSEKLRPQGFDGGMGDHTDSKPDNTFKGTNFPDIIHLSGSFISSSPKLVHQGTDYVPFKLGSATSARVKIEYTGENKIPTKYPDPYPDNNSTPLKTTTVRKGTILLKRNSQSSEVDLSAKEKSFNESIVSQDQSELGPISCTEKVGSDDHEEGQTDTCQGQMYPSPDDLDLDDTMKSFERPLVSQPPQGDMSALEMPINMTEHRLPGIETVQMEEDVIYTDMNGKPESYSNTESFGDQTVERLPLTDDAERIVSLDTEIYDRIKESNDSVYREKRYDLKPLRPRPMISAEFPLPPPPEVQTSPFSEGDVDNQGKTGQQYGKKEVFPKLTHETEDAVGKLKLPDPVQLKDLNPLILRLLVKNVNYRQMFDKNLSDINGVARWPSSLEDCVIIECTVKVEDKNASSLLKDWSIRIVDKVDNFAAGIEVAEFNLIQIAWPRVLKELENIRVDNPEDVGVFIEQDKYSITLAGSRGTMEKLKKSVLDMIAMVIAEIKHDKQRVTEKKQMNTYAIILLGESDFKQEIKKMYPGLHFDLNLKEKNAIFVGQADIVQKAVVQMHEKLQSFVSRSMQMSKLARDLLFGKEITEYIKQKMKSQKVIGVWDVLHTEEVQMFAWDEVEVQKAIQLVRDCLVEKEILLDDVMAQNVKRQQWLQLVERIQEKHKQKVAIETSMRSILVVAKDDIFQDVFSKIKDYLEEHSVKEFFLALNLVKMKFIKRYKMEDIKALEKKIESSHVKLFIIDYGDQHGIKINGTKDECSTLEMALAEMAKNIITKEHAMVSRVGLKELFQCSRGQDELSVIEVRWKCLIEMKGSSTSVSLQLEGASGGYSSGSEDDADESNEPNDRQPSSDSGGTSIDACGIKVSFVKGELAKQKVDVIVNSTNEKLNLRIGAISKSIIEYGGDTIQRECLQHYPNGISPGQVVVTGGGNLSCMNVYHGCLRAYDGGKGKSLKLMKTFVKNCLKQADKTGFHSMAFPALGTGNLRFPADEVGKLILQCIQNFGKKTPKTSLKDIALVVFPSDINNIKAFTALFVGPTVPSTSKIKSATLTSNISMNHGLCRCTFPHSVVLEMIEGDITKEITDVIVNSVRSDLNLNQGNVSKAILKAGGISIQQEYVGKDLKKDGFVVTKAGNLLCKMIIHMVAQNKRKEWEDMIGRVLHQADQLKCESISFPALGTGGKGLSPKKIAQAIYSSCTEFANSQPVCLKKIRVVLFKKMMLTEFYQAIKDYSPGQRESRLSKFPVAGTLFRERSRQNNLVFCITIDSESNFKAAVRDLEGFVKNELTEKEINSPGEIISKLLDVQVTQIEGMGQGKAMVSVNRKKGVIKVSGTHREVLDTYDNITKYLHNIEGASETFTKA